MKTRFLISLLILAAATALFWSCGSQKQAVVNHYVLEYYSNLEREELELNEPFPYTAIVKDPVIPTIYDRRQIVIRHFGPRITYSDNDLWAVPLSEIIPRLIMTRLNRYHIFTITKREFLNQQPDFEILTDIRYVEALKYENKMQARLVMDFYLRKTGTENYIIKHTVNREEPLVDNNLENFVQKLNDLILVETDNFTAKIIRYFKYGESSVSDDNRGIAASEISPDDTTHHVQEGEGLLVLPAITKTENEPYYTVYNDDREAVASEKMGKSVKLPSGFYTVKYGSGTERQMMTRRGVKVSPRYKTVIEPDWGCLSIEVISENRDYVKTRYELFDGEDGKSYGTEFPADEEQGEINRIWILKPGLYKVTINNEPFNAYRDFTTVYVEEGTFQTLKLVVGLDEEGNPTHLVGGGVLGGSEMSARIGNYQLDNAIHGNFNYTSDNENEEYNPQSTILLNTQFDSRIVYDKKPIHATLNNLVEIETNKSTGNDFRISYDEIYSKNTFVYYFFKNIGLYTRLDVDTHIFPRNEYSPGNYVKIDRSGDTIGWYPNVSFLQIKPSLYPLVAKEGLGVNYLILNYPKARLNLRAGAGRRQDYNRGFYYKSVEAPMRKDSLNYSVYREYEDFDQMGTEFSLVGNFQFPFDISYGIDADVLMPFDKSVPLTFDMENTINMRLFKYLSLDYKLRLKNIARENQPEYISKRHVLFLRLTYILR